MLCDGSKAKRKIWRRSWKKSSSIFNEWDRQRSQNSTAQTPEYQSPLMSKEGRDFSLLSSCVSCKCKLIADPRVLQGVVQPTWGRGVLSARCGAALKDRWVTCKRGGGNPNPEYQQFPSKEGNWWESLSRSELLHWDRASCWGKWQLFVLSSGDGFYPEAGRWEWPSGCLGAGGSLNFTYV